MHTLTATIYNISGDPFAFVFEYDMEKRPGDPLVTVKTPMFLDESFGTGWIDDLVSELDKEIGKDYELKIIE
jgi:hypothetical protein